MPYSEKHKKQKSKNYTVLALIALFMVIVFFITMIRLKGA